MTIDLINQSAACCRETVRQTKVIRENAECIVPDVLEDVGQIAFTETQICLKSKDVNEYGVRFGAEAQISVFYITESRDRVRCVRINKALDADFDCPGLAPDAEAQLVLSCQGVQARAVNPRKIAVQISVRADLSCWAEACFELPVGVGEEADGSLRLRRGKAQSVLTVRTGEKSFVLSEQLPLDEEEEGVSIVSARCELLYSEHQIIGSKALLKGGAQLRIGYERPGKAVPAFTEQWLPFSVLIDMPDEDCAIGRVRLQPTALYAELSDAINGRRVIELELHAAAQVCFEKKTELSFLTDAYSTRFPTEIGRAAIPVCLEKKTMHLSAGTSEQLQIERDRGEIAACGAEILSFAVKDGKGTVSASVSLLLRAGDGSLGVQQRLLTAETALPDEDGEVLAARVGSVSARRQGDEIALELVCDLDYAHDRMSEISCLTALELNTENAFDPAERPSLIVTKRQGRDLWELARLCLSSEDAIAALSEQYDLPGDLLLIPRV